jgi:hypothetical protein
MEITALTFINTTAELHAWLQQHQDTAKELWVGFYKKGFGLVSTTYPETLDEVPSAHSDLMSQTYNEQCGMTNSGRRI